MRKLIRPSLSDPRHSIDLFDRDTENEFGGMLCVAPAILPGEVEGYWRDYVKNNGVAM